MQASNKLTAYIGFSIKARKIVYGYDNVMSSRRVLAVIAVEGINRTAKNELTAYCEEKHIPLDWCDEATLQQCVNRVGCKCIGLTDASLARAAHEEIARMRRE
jgi:ribosomal protein L7Ae-like RNA K-turn-binding protein